MPLEMSRDCVLPQFAFRLTCFALRMSAGHSRVYAAVELLHLRSTLAMLAIASSSKGRAVHLPPRPSGSPAVRLLFAVSSLGLQYALVPLSIVRGPSRVVLQGHLLSHHSPLFICESRTISRENKLWVFEKKMALRDDAKRGPPD